MNLKDFIFTALTEIDEGINQAFEKTNKEAWISTGPEEDGVLFDVAVSVGKEGSMGAGGQIQGSGKIVVISVISGQVNTEAHVKAEGKLSEEHVSRIKFRLHVNIYKGKS